MKTLIFPSEFTTNKGGAPQSIISLVRGVAKDSSFQVVLVCPNASEMSKIDFPDNVIVVQTKQNEWNVNRKRILETIYTVFDLYLSLRKYIGEETWFVTNQPFASAILDLMPIHHCNEVYINRGGDFNDSGMASKIIRRKIKKNKINYSVGISQSQVNMLINSGMPPNRVFLVHNGVPIPKVPYPYRSLDPKCLRISTMGFLSDLKNQLEGIKLVKLCRDNGINAYLNMYGATYDDSDYNLKLSNLIKELGVTEFINYCGFVSGEDLYKDTDILISFSKSEGFGRSLVEGMMRKFPVIAWRGAGGGIDITNNGEFGHLVDHNEAIDYFTVIKQLLSSPEKNKMNVESSYDFAMSNFSDIIMVEKYVNLLKKICV